MAENLLQSLGGLITPSVLETAAKTFDAPKDAISGGLGAAFPSILSGILGGAQQPGFLDGITDLIGSNDLDTDMLNDIGGLVGGGSQGGIFDLGGRLLEGVFAGNLGKIAESIGSLVGLSPQVSRSLMSLAAPIILGMLKKKLLGAGGLNPAGLLGLLDGERDSIQAAVPEGVMSILGQTQPAAPAPATAPTPSPQPSAGEGDDGSGAVMTLLWILIGLAIVFALYWLFV